VACAYLRDYKNEGLKKYTGHNYTTMFLSGRAMLDFKKIFAGMAPGGYDAVSACYFNYRFF
jgi:hypothetical protein